MRFHFVQTTQANISKILFYYIGLKQETFIYSTIYTLTSIFTFACNYSFLAYNFLRSNFYLNFISHQEMEHTVYTYSINVTQKLSWYHVFSMANIFPQHSLLSHCILCSRQSFFQSQSRTVSFNSPTFSSLEIADKFQSVWKPDLLC